MLRILLIFILFLASTCIRRDNGMRSHVPVCTLAPATARFEYNIMGHPVVETMLDSTYTCKLIFDTGSAGMLILDKRFAEKSGLIDRFCHTGTLKSGWDFGRDIPCMSVEHPVSISVGNSRVYYSGCQIVDGRSLNFLAADGIFSIPHDETRMWEVDCENKILAIYDYPVISLRGVPFQMDIVGYQYVIRGFPFRFRSRNGYVQPRVDMVLDTGSPASIVYLYAEPESTMRSVLSEETTQKYDCPCKNEVATTCYRLDECGLLNRKLWIEYRELLRPWRISGEREMIVAGMDFLKSFNLRFYPNRNLIELIPIAYVTLQEDISRQEGSAGSRFRAFKSKEGNAVVDFVKEGAYWQDFGVEEGDVILDVDGQRLFDLPRSYFDEVKSGVHFTIVRDRDTLFIQTRALQSYGNS